MEKRYRVTNYQYGEEVVGTASELQAEFDELDSLTQNGEWIVELRERHDGTIVDDITGQIVGEAI